MPPMVKPYVEWDHSTHSRDADYCSALDQSFSDPPRYSQLLFMMFPALSAVGRRRRTASANGYRIPEDGGYLIRPIERR